MRNIPRTAVEAARSEFFSQWKNQSFGQDMEAAIAAALPHLQATVAIQPLHWLEPCSATNGTWAAKTPFGTYYVSNEDGWYAGLDDNIYERFEWVGTRDPCDQEKAFAAAQADYETRVLPLLSIAPIVPSTMPVRIVHHKKRGSTYEVIGSGRMQADQWFDNGDPACPSVDMREVAIYRAQKDGSLWARPIEEFEDGRFEDIQSLDPASEMGTRTRPITDDPVKEQMAEALQVASYYIGRQPVGAGFKRVIDAALAAYKKEAANAYP